MTIRRAPRTVARSLPLLATLVVLGCRSAPSTEPMYAGEARTTPVTRRAIERVQPPARQASGAIIAPEDCGESFGDSVAVQGSLIVVGAPKAGDAGKAWIYDAEHLDRAPICLLPPPGVRGERFGASVSISPAMDRIVVGAPFAEIDGVAEMGRVYCWRREGDIWKFDRTFSDPDPAKGPARLGRSVIIDESCVYAGAPHASMELRDDIEVPVHGARSDDPLDDARPAVRTESRLRGRFEREGAVLIWQRDAQGTWNGPQYALLPRGRPGARFGTTLARHSLSGEDLLAVGAPTQRTKVGVEGGTVSVFIRRQGSPWRGNAQVLIAPQRAEPSDFFGGSIAMGDNILAIGMAQANLDTAVDAGEVAIFQQDVTTRYWNEGIPSLASPMIEVGSRFGSSVVMMGQAVIAGQPLATRADGTGRAFLFRKLGEKGAETDPRKAEQPWKPIAELVPPPFLKARGFGNSMAAGDDWVAVGASGDGGPGCVTLFRIDRDASGVTAKPTLATEPVGGTSSVKPAVGASDTPAAAAAAPEGQRTTTPPIGTPTPVSNKEGAVAPTAPGTLQPGADRRTEPLPTQAEPARLYETPPETPNPKDGTAPAAPTRERPTQPAGSPYETPPETPGTKP